MGASLTRRAALGLGAAVTAAVTAPAAASATQPTCADDIRRAYRFHTGRAGGAWESVISLNGQDLVAARADDVVEAYSVNKVAVATAVLDKVDRGLLTLTQRVEVTADIVLTTGDGIIPLDGAYPSSITLGHVLALLLTVSDDTCVRLCGLVVPALEVNQILVDKGFPKTQVDPVANPNRFFLGKTTPRETHDLLRALAAGTLLSPASTAYLLGILRSQAAHTDGIRRDMSSVDRARVATKAGWFKDGRNEAGIVFDAQNNPALIYALFSQGAGPDPNDFGGTHPAIKARAALGPLFLNAVPATTSRTAYAPTNGG
ncbi:serine hydrolase [Actinokineospora auranticolor]|uniref:Beta-lactamase n=1 Tax=Actinokineospora auranticolor TaxID=155976 RepID=A0A2S6GQK4_9PSEU|nr:serine hydrolase [Actinokineospora auranticolor]PPK67479.1 beta-lactamase class A [Actinokineospora auranticolor]